MSRNRWTDPDPGPGDLDVELGLLDEIAEARGQNPSQVLAELLRDAAA